MTNPLKGEVHFEARGETFTFKLGTNAQILLESKTGMSMSKFIKERFEELSTKDARLVFWAGLFRNHEMTEEDAGDLMDELGGPRVAEIFLEAFKSASETNGAADPPRPRKAVKARIGMNS